MNTTCSTTRDSVLAKLMEDYLASCEAGQPLTAEELAERYPELADDVAACLASIKFIERAADCRERPPWRSEAGDGLVSFGNFELQGELGRGGMGIVYRARHMQLNRTVALKMIRAGHLASPAEIERFQSEATAAASLDHPNIVPIYEVGQQAGQRYFTMKLIEGTLARSASEGNERHASNNLQPTGTLARSASEGIECHASNNLRPTSSSNQSHRQSARLIATVASAVHYAHQRGILHRDLKPSNILLEWPVDKAATSGRGLQFVCVQQDALPIPYVTDFGLAKRFETDSSLTHTGDIIGTPLYMAPEQAAGQKNLTTAADIYSLGAILYWLLTGQPAIQAATPLETLRQVQDQEPVSPRSLDGDIDRDLETICLKCLEKDPLRRYASAAALADDLHHWLHGDPILARPLTRPERYYRWCRRSPVVATLSAAIILIASLALFGVLNQWQAAVASEQKAVVAAADAQGKAQEANQQRDEAQKQRDEVRAVNEKLRATQDQLRRTSYAAHMKLAQDAWETGGIAQALELLERYRPRQGEADLRGFEWYYLHRQCYSSDLLTFTGHTSAVRCVAYSRDGKRIASGGNDEVIVWDSETGKEILNLPGGAWKLAFSSDGKRLIIRGLEDKIIACDAQTGQKQLVIQDTSWDFSVAFSPDDKRLATASGPFSGKEQTGQVKVWDANTGAKLFALDDTRHISHLAFSPDGRRLAGCEGNPDMTLDEPAQTVVRVWDVQNGQKLLDIKGHPCDEIAFSPDGKYLAGPSSRDGTMLVWDSQSGQELLKFTANAPYDTKFAYSPDSKCLAIGTIGGTVRIWDAQTGREHLKLRGHTATVGCVAFSPDGERLASASQDHTVKVWDARTSQQALSIRSGAFSFHTAAFSPDSQRVAGSSGLRNVSLWNAQTGEDTLTFTVSGPNRRVTGVAFSPDGKRLATRASDQTISVWDTQTGQRLLNLTSGRIRMGDNIAFSPDGQRLACSVLGSGELRLDVKIWDALSGTELLTLPDQRGVAFSPDGRQIATGSFVNFDSAAIVNIWNAQSGENIHSLAGHTGLVFCVVFSPDGKQLASASFDGTVKLWDSASGAELHTLRGHSGQVYGVAFSPDGKRLASGSLDQTVKLWDTQTGQETLTLRGHTSNVWCVAFSPDGHRLVSTSMDQTAMIWNAAPIPEAQALEHRLRQGAAKIEATHPQLPWGWGGGGNADYWAGVDKAIHHGGNASAFIKSKFADRSGFAGMTQAFRADAYRGKRLRLSTYVKADQIDDWAALWMRVDSETKAVAFDNMQDRPIKGTNDWTRHEIVLDVPPEAVDVVFGFFLVGKGLIWADDFQFEVVGREIPTTNPLQDGETFKHRITPTFQTKPLNLDFEK